MADNQDRDKYFEEREGSDEARFHVVPNDEEGWAVKEEGNDNPTFTSNDKDEAVKEAKRLAEEAGTMAYIHNDDGRIEEQVNYMD
ncbi:DUF2188 domain-containing protein [Chungangia koreensis]|uniref:DUF2188 domain-containing protein n=1 Tax=Chungangia koreensis TaxID=752657 RepID=A0ABV8X2B6_9LACT